MFVMYWEGWIVSLLMVVEYCMYWEKNVGSRNIIRLRVYKKDIEVS